MSPLPSFIISILRIITIFTAMFCDICCFYNYSSRSGKGKRVYKTFPWSWTNWTRNTHSFGLYYLPLCHIASSFIKKIANYDTIKHHTKKVAIDFLILSMSRPCPHCLQYKKKKKMSEIFFLITTWNHFLRVIKQIVLYIFILPVYILFTYHS